MMTEEGGMLITSDEDIARIAQMVRNHGEMIQSTDKKRSYKSEFLGWGYRMTELEAAIGIVQLSKLDELNQRRIELANFMTKKLENIEGITHIKYEHVKHVYYVYSMFYDEEKIGIPRDLFCEAMRAEGIPFFGGYVKPLYLNPLYQEKRAFAFRHHQGKANYKKGICPVAESLYAKYWILTPVLRFPVTKEDVADLVNAMIKVLDKKEFLK